MIKIDIQHANDIRDACIKLNDLIKEAAYDGLHVDVKTNIKVPILGREYFYRVYAYVKRIIYTNPE